MFKGRIYKIFCIRPDVSQVYIGQTTEKTLQMRWNKHKREAKEFLYNKSPTKFRGKAVKLHGAMNVMRIDEMKIEELEFYQYEDKNELLNKLDERENHFIDKFNSTKEGVGWNKVSASKIKRPLGQDPKDIWETIANKHGVDTRSLSHQVNKNGLSIEEAVERIKELDKKPTRQYSYGKQTYDFIIELLLYDKNNIGKKTIERRIRTLSKNLKLKVDLDKENNTETVFLIDSIFDPISSREERVVNTPHGKEKGSIQKLHDKLLPLYPDNVPDSYTTVQNRIIGKRFKGKWSNDQAFGFRYPPGFEEVEDLIEKGYQWGEIDGVQCIPSFKKESKRITKSNPIILHSVQRVYFTEEDWCDAYKLTDRKTIKKLRDEDKTNEEILEYYGKKP